MEKPGSPQLPTSSFQSELDKIDYSWLQTTIHADVTNNNGHSAGGEQIVKKRLTSSSLLDEFFTVSGVISSND